MKRSEINVIMREALVFFEQMKFHLPDYCFWSPEQWGTIGAEANEIRENSLGWDITDFGRGNFFETGLLLITLRNGNLRNTEKHPKPYAEKIMIVRENQVTPMHFHHYKMEDIINRSGGNLMIRLYNATGDDLLADTPVTVAVDGVTHTVEAGTELCLRPGQSITLTQRMYHSFWGEAGKGTVLVGEVSMCNNDESDNRFYEEIGRFASVEEDTPPLHLLCNEYPAAKHTMM